MNEDFRKRIEKIATKEMTRAEQSDLLKIVRLREKVAKTAVIARSAQLRAEFEQQISMFAGGGVGLATAANYLIGLAGFESAWSRTSRVRCRDRCQRRAQSLYCAMGLTTNDAMRFAYCALQGDRATLINLESPLRRCCFQFVLDGLARSAHRRLNESLTNPRPLSRKRESRRRRGIKR